MESELVRWGVVVFFSLASFFLAIFICRFWVKSFADRYWNLLAKYEKEVALLVTTHKAELAKVEERHRKREGGLLDRAEGAEEELADALKRLKKLEARTSWVELLPAFREREEMEVL